MAGPSIIHIALQEASPGEAARIVAQLRDPSGVFSPVVHHRMDGALEFSSVDMTSVDDVHYAATIPGALVTGSFHCYIEAYDDVGNGPSLAGTEASPLFVRSDAPLPDAAVDSPRLPVGPMITTGTGALAAIAGLALSFVAAGQVSAVDARYSRPGLPRLPADAAAMRSAQGLGATGSARALVGGLAAAGGAVWWLLPTGGDRIPSGLTAGVSVDF